MENIFYNKVKCQLEFVLQLLYPIPCLKTNLNLLQMVGENINMCFVLSFILIF